MTDSQRQDVRDLEQHEAIPELEIDETIAPRPEEEAADIGRSVPAPRVQPRDARPRLSTDLEN